MNENVDSYDQMESVLVRTMALLCVRNTILEDIHAGPWPATKTGDYSDVTVIDADGQRIPWNEVSHFDDDTMRMHMRQVVDRLYTFQTRLEEPGFLDRIGLWMAAARRLDEPKLDESFFSGAAVGGE